MQPVQRTAVRSLRRLRPQLQRQPRRHASDSHGSHDAHPMTGHKETIGAGFYIALAAIPASIALFKFSSSGENPYFTRLIGDKYREYKTRFQQTNDLHTQAIEQAAADRVLFLNEASQNVRHVDIRYPEQFNHGSPWNVPAGQGHVNIDQVIAKFEKDRQEDEDKKLQQLRENKVPAEQPLAPLTKEPPATTSA